MDIRWLAGTSFSITAANGSVITDPLSGAAPDPDPGEAATVVTLSHDGAAHEAIAAWRRVSRVLEGPGEYEVSGLGIRGIATPLGDTTHGEDGAPPDDRAINTVYVIDADGLSVCHLGAISGPLTTQALQMIGKVDVLLAPAGGSDQVLSADQAAALVRSLEPRMVIPMHPAVRPGDSELSVVEPFISELGAARPDPVPRISVTRSNIGDALRVVLLRPVA